MPPLTSVWWPCSVLPVFPWNYPGKSKLMPCIIVGDFVHELRHNWLGLFRSPLVVLSCLVLSIYLTPCGNEFRNSALVDMHTTMDHFVFVSSLCVLCTPVCVPACLPASQPAYLPACRIRTLHFALAWMNPMGELDAACLSGLCAGRRQNSK